MQTPLRNLVVAAGMACLLSCSGGKDAGSATGPGDPTNTGTTTSQAPTYVTWTGNANGTVILDYAQTQFAVRVADNTVVDLAVNTSLTGLTVTSSGALYQQGVPVGSAVLTNGTNGSKVMQFTYNYGGQNGVALIVLANGAYTVTCGNCQAPPPPATTTVGQISFWTNAVIPGGIALTMDGGSIGQLTQYFPTGTPTCGQAGTLTVSLSAGSHTFTGASQSLRWGPTSINVVAGQCELQQLLGSSSGGSTSSGTCPASLAGNWKRTQDYGITGATGVIVSWNGTDGVVTSNPGGSAIAVGTVKWQQYDPQGCTIYDLLFALPNGPSQTYQQYSVSLSGTQLTLGGTVYQKQ